MDGPVRHEHAPGVPEKPDAQADEAAPAVLPAPRAAADAQGPDLRTGMRPTADVSPDGALSDGAATDGADDLSGTVVALIGDEIDQAERRRLLGRLVGQLGRRGVTDLFRPSSAVRWLADAVNDVAPRLPIRDIATLRRHHPGLTDAALAERLIRNAARATAAVGAASGGVASIEWVATPTLLSAPILMAAETVVVVAIEVKLIGELHEVLGQPVPGTSRARAVALVQAWARRRGVNPIAPGMGVATVLGAAARKELRDRLLRRFGRSLTTYGPLLTGAAVASYLNRRATITLGGQIRADLSHRRLPR